MQLLLLVATSCHSHSSLVRARGRQLAGMVLWRRVSALAVAGRRGGNAGCWGRGGSSSCRRHLHAIIIGAPGSGKGTISKKLLKDFPFTHISTGDLLREAVRLQTPLGMEAQKHMDAGGLVPDDTIIKMLKDAVTSLGSQGAGHVLLDGFPRTTAQATSLENFMQVDFVLNLDVPRDTIVERLTDRWIHPASGRVYAYSYRPPKKHGVDDETGEDLVRREDDSPAVVLSRLAKYDEITAPLLSFYAERGVLTSFSGTMSDVIYKDVEPFVRSKFEG